MSLGILCYLSVPFSNDETKTPPHPMKSEILMQNLLLKCYLSGVSCRHYDKSAVGNSFVAYGKLKSPQLCSRMVIL